MGRFAGALRLGEPAEPISKRHELLLGLSATSDPDGEAATFVLHYTNQKPFLLHMPLLQATGVLHAMRDLTVQMIERKHLSSLDRGAGFLLELCQSAPRPATYDILVDPVTHDRVFVYQFDHEAPISLRMSADEFPIMLARAAQAAAKACN